jgi:hypothetical protein
MLAAIAAWLAVRGTAPEERATIEAALSAWTWLRYDGRALVRRARDRPRAKDPSELRVTGAPLAAFVEPAPEAIARLVGVLRQAQKGLATLGLLDSGAPALTGLADVEELMRGALRVAEHEVNDEALDDVDRAALASMPARLATLEVDAPTVGASVVVASDGAGRVLVSQADLVEPLARIVREPGSGRLVVAVAAHVAHEEGRAARGAPGPWARTRAPWTSAFRPSLPSRP